MTITFNKKTRTTMYLNRHVRSIKVLSNKIGSLKNVLEAIMFVVIHFGSPYKYIKN
jgi:hypothetical protein